MPLNDSIDNIHPIDAVISWVDGNDPVFKKKMATFLEGQCPSKIPGAHLTRFASINEIKYCVLSILTFAPFVRNIFIVTNGQDPNLYDDINRYFPERKNCIRIVDHSEIFRDFEDFLPTFSSRAIESMTWRIKGLSDNFIYFNDDTFLIRNVEPTDWFINSRPVLRGRWLPRPIPRIIWDYILILTNKWLLQKSAYHPRPSFHLGQWLAAKRLGFMFRYFVFSHTPHAINRKMSEDFASSNKAMLEKNISYRFRNHHQFNFVSLTYHLELLNGNRNIQKPCLAYIQPFNRSKNYIDKKIRFCESNHSI